mmetsp:Transcript_28838/g.79159  ORF Transcript_28838/g.79159 Transcript_28838/m.79159 type:complete len:375 (-) Transcript_28838:61-1185(-)
MQQHVDSLTMELSCAQDKLKQSQESNEEANVLLKKANEQKNELEKSMQQQVDSVAKELSGTQDMLQQSQESNEETKALLKKANKDLDALAKEKSKAEAQVQLVGGKLSAASEANVKYSVDLAKRARELDEAKSKLAYLESARNKLEAEFAACAIAANDVEGLIRSIDVFSQVGAERVAAGTSDTNSSSVNGESGACQSDAEKSNPSDSEDIQNAIARIWGVVKKAGGNTKKLSESHAELSRVVVAYEEEVFQAKDRIKRLTSDVEALAAEKRVCMRDLDCERTRQRALELALKRKEDEYRKVENSFQVTAKENLILREKMISLKEARAAKCVNLELELDKVRAAFRYLEHEIHTEVSRTPRAGAHESFYDAVDS